MLSKIIVADLIPEFRFMAGEPAKTPEEVPAPQKQPEIKPTVPPEINPDSAPAPPPPEIVPETAPEISPPSDPELSWQIRGSNEQVFFFRTDVINDRACETLCPRLGVLNQQLNQPSAGAF
jgi:hypothetical protein